ncbi:PspC family transcriptional regulator [Paenibacillus baekrokdamisoli]|uniref:PspC family transcriptional regulator n=1 Tax=Paenibacillus baekrokdamisoli TaxID=1712516 RepID=A0A3G9IVI7_9BACL|nr:PspC domain-containing protein [Paenibacillus baekrokdamisoli]MBB3068099.1 phage shock protein PspC (stress-responsive transcriptional regulator) [Paenibacillus baekrokdamisoli]BBH22857.1 PspC family transcriptional regulator [Paenibacillus baekrokdamisoli]
MKKLYRSTMDRKLTGLSAGIGEWLGVDTTIVRLVLIASACFSFGTTFLLYILSSMIVPKAPYEVLYTNNLHKF